ncbi:MAG TPA: ribonuclease HII [Pantanalinema sp.]
MRDDMWSIEQSFWARGDRHLAGLDEVGRGPLVGAVVAACVVLPGPDHPAFEQSRLRLTGLTDSKKLSKARRDHFASVVKEVALAWAIAECSAEEIDRLNILKASHEAMARALRRVRKTLKPERLLVDGHLKIKGIRAKQEALVKGDSRSMSIAAASVIAKVHRDAQMVALHAKYPVYGFDRHKGYPTAEHLDAIAAHGLTPHHRQSFGPCRTLSESREG